MYEHNYDVSLAIGTTDSESIPLVGIDKTCNKTKIDVHTCN